GLLSIRRAGTPGLRPAGGDAHALPHRHPAAAVLRPAGTQAPVRTGPRGHHGPGPPGHGPRPAHAEVSAESRLTNPGSDRLAFHPGAPTYIPYSYSGEHDEPCPSPMRSLPRRRAPRLGRGT